MKDQICPEVRKERNAIYRAVFEKSAKAYRQKFIGKLLSVLFNNNAFFFFFFFFGSVRVAGKIRESDNPNFGFNAETDTYEDLVASGVIDPTKVTRTALQNAASIASLMLTTEAMIAEIPEKKQPMGGGGPGHGPEMDY